MKNNKRQNRVRADMIKYALQKKHAKDFFLTEVKTGPTGWGEKLYIIDAVAIRKSWANPCLTAYEVKVDRSDFTRDEKWRAYMHFCHQMAFACPAGLIQPDELPEEVGLYYYDNGKLVTKRKPVYRAVEVPSNVLMYIIMSRLDSDRHPFFSDEREFIMAWLEDKQDRKEIGRIFGLKVAERIQELKKEIYELKKVNSDLDLYRRLNELLREYGIQLSRYSDWEEELRRRLEAKTPIDVKRYILYLYRTADELRKIIEQEDEKLAAVES